MSKPSHMIGHNVTLSRPQRSRLGDCLDSALRFFSIALLQYMPVYGQLSGGSAVVLSHSISFQRSAAILKRKNNARHAPCAVTQAVTSLPAGLSGLCERFEQVPFLVPFFVRSPLFPQAHLVFHLTLRRAHYGVPCEGGEGRVIWLMVPNVGEAW